MTKPNQDEPAEDPKAPPGREELGFDVPPPAELPKKRLVVYGAIATLVLGVAFVAGYLPRRQASASLSKEAKASEKKLPRVEVVTPKVLPSDHALELPATVQPLEETVVFPRSNGYVRRWLVDIGDHVEADQLLAEVDTPEIDQELSQAEAQLAQADAAEKQVKANLNLDRVNLDRAVKLASEGVTSQQDLDQRRGQTEADEANLNAAGANRGAAAANVQRLRDLKSFARLVSPFAGTVTARTVERGALVTAGSSTPLFKVASLNPMRIFVSVPQDVAPSVEPGVHADVQVREFPGRTFQAEVTRSTRELDAQTRTMSTELLAPNPDGKLLAGMYATVAFALPSPHRTLEIPSTALYSDSRGRRVAIVDANQEAHFVPVVVERDTGPTVQISVGLDGTERVVKFANAALADGTKVDVAE